MTETETRALRLMAIAGDEDPGGPAMVELLQEIRQLPRGDLVDLVLELAATAVTVTQALAELTAGPRSFHELVANFSGDEP